MVVQSEFLGYSANTLPFMRRAMALDPLSISMNLSYGYTLFLAGQYEEAIAQFKESVTLAPNFDWAWLALGTTYMQLDRFDEARQLAEDIEDAQARASFRSWIDLIAGEVALVENDPEVDRLIG